MAEVTIILGLATVGANGVHCCMLGGMGRAVCRGREVGAAAIDTTGTMARSGAGAGIICGTDAATAVAAACCWATAGPGTCTVCACTVVMPGRGNTTIKCRIQPMIQTSDANAFP